MPVRLLLLVILGLLVPGNQTAYCDELPTTLVSAAVNQDGRYEVFGVNSAGMLFHRWQTTGRSTWAGWAPNFFGKISDVDPITARDGRLFAFVLDGGTLVIRSQQSANSGWSDQFLRTGHDLKRIKAAVNQDGRLEVFALGGDGALYSIAQKAIDSRLVESDWITRALEGHDLREIAASRDGSGCLVVFAVGQNGQVYFRKQESANGAFSPWSGLDGHDIQRISAANQSAGSITVFGLGDNGALYSRTQVRPNEAWQPWVTVFDSPVSDWSTTKDDSGLLTVAALSSPGVRFIVQDAAGGYFRFGKFYESVEVPQTGIQNPNNARGSLEPFIQKDLPIHRLSLQRGLDGGLRLFAINDAGEVYSIERPADPNSSGTWMGKSWQWLGTAPISGNEPDVVAQMESCIDKLFPPERIADFNRIINEDLPARIASGGAGTPFAQLARNVSIATVCLPNGPNNFRQTIGVWLGHQATPDVLNTVTVVDAGHSFAYRINANALRRVFAAVWDAQPKNLSVAGQSISLLSYELEFVDNPPPSNDQIKLTVHAQAHELGQDIGLQATAFATFLIAKVWPLSSLDARGPLCGLKVSLGGEGALGNAAEILVNAVGDLIGFSLSSAQAKVLAVVQPVCSISKAILTSQLLPRNKSTDPLQTLGIDYDSIAVNNDGLTAFAVLPPLPRDRDPQVDWQVIDGTTRFTEYSGGHIVSFFVEAITEDMNPNIVGTNWSYDYPLSDASVPVTAWVTDEAGTNLTGPNFNKPRINLIFSIPNNINLNSLQLGTLTVTVMDSDAQTATAHRQVR